MKTKQSFFPGLIFLFVYFTAIVCSASAQGSLHYVYDKTFTLGAEVGGIAVLDNDTFIYSNYITGAIYKYSGGASSGAVTTWTNPLNSSDTFTFTAGFSTGPRGCSKDNNNKIYTVSLDTDHNILVWNNDLTPTNKRLKIAPATGSSGHVFTAKTDTAGYVYILYYYGIPSGRQRIEIFPPASSWDDTHTTTPIHSIYYNNSSAAYQQGLAVKKDGSAFWISDRVGRKIVKFSGSIVSGFTIDSSFNYDLTNSSSNSTGFRGIVLSEDETVLYISDDSINKILAVDSSTGGEISNLAISMAGSGATHPFDLDFDSSSNLYVVHSTEGVVEKYYQSTEATPTPTPSPTPTVSPTPTITPTPTPAADLPELRGMWVTRFEWPKATETETKAYIDTVMSDLANANFNAVFFQIRGQMDVLYPSPDEPWSTLIYDQVSTPPLYDPLAYAIQKAHENGLEFHAYINTHTCWQSKTNLPPPQSTPEHPYFKYCDTATGNDAWVVADASGNKVPWEESGYVWCAPGIPDFQSYVRKQIMYVVENYDIDGVHFDRIRTPGPEYSHDPISNARLAGEGNPDYLGFEDWTRDQIVRFTADVYGQIQLVKPNLKVSCAPLGLYKQDRYPATYSSSFQYGYSVVYQDAQAMLELGSMDFIVPQIYWANGGTKPDFNEVLPDWLQHNASRFVCPGQTSTMGSTELRNNVNFSRANGGNGAVFFSYGSMKAMLNDFKTTVFSIKVPTPEYSWKSNPTYGTIAGFVYDSENKPVADAKINRSGAIYNTLSSGDGFYTILKVPLNEIYTITASESTKGQAELDNVEFEKDTNVLRLDITLTTATLTPTPTPTETPEPTPTETPIITPTPAETPVITPTVTPAVTPTDTPAPTPSVTPTPTQTPEITPTPTVTPTPTPVSPILSYNFTETEEDWTTASIPQFFTEPSFTWTPGYIQIQSTGLNTFGWWQSPNGGFDVEQGNIYRIETKISCSESDLTKNPQFRIRTNDSSFQQSNYLNVSSVGNADESPGIDGKNYNLYFETIDSSLPDEKYFLSIDIVNQDSNDTIDAVFNVDYVNIYKYPKQDIAFSENIYTAGFDTDNEGWFFSGRIAPFTSLESGWENQAVYLKSNNNLNSFGFLNSPEISISDYDSSTIFVSEFVLYADNNYFATSPQFRLRAGESQGKNISVLSVESNSDSDKTLIETGRKYSVYYYAAATKEKNILLAFDMININPSDISSAGYYIDQVNLKTFRIE